MNNYKGLIVYQKSYNLALDVYKLSADFPQEERFGLTSQMKRASTSIPLNIAEGYGKRNNGREYSRFLMMAIGSCDEIRVLLDFCKDLGFMSDENYHSLYAGYDEVGKMLNSLHKSWENPN